MERFEDLKKLANLLEKKREELTNALINEIGMTRKYINIEMNMALNILNSFELYRPKIKNRKPLGKIAILVPYNAPIGLTIISVASAYITNNKIIIKLSSKLPETSKILENILKSTLKEIELSNKSGENFIKDSLESKDINAIQIFGYDGWAIQYKDLVKKTKKKFIFEGPGKDPFIVLKDSEIEKAAKDAVIAATLNSGQLCLSPERFYIHQDVQKEFLKKVKQEIKNLRLGNPNELETDVGPIGSEKAVKNIKKQLDDAIKKGAKIEFGGNIKPFYKFKIIEPTILTNINHSMLIIKNESFSPIIPILTFKDEKEVIGLANDSKYGLSASIYGKDTSKIKSELSKTHGSIFENQPFFLAFNPHSWGGYKNSGWIWETVNGEFQERSGPKNLVEEFSRGSKGNK